MKINYRVRKGYITVWGDDATSRYKMDTENPDPYVEYFVQKRINKKKIGKKKFVDMYETLARGKAGAIEGGEKEWQRRYASAIKTASHIDYSTRRARDTSRIFRRGSFSVNSSSRDLITNPDNIYLRLWKKAVKIRDEKYARENMQAMRNRISHNIIYVGAGGEELSRVKLQGYNIEQLKPLVEQGPQPGDDLPSTETKKVVEEMLNYLGYRNKAVETATPGTVREIRIVTIIKGR